MRKYCLSKDDAGISDIGKLIINPGLKAAMMGYDGIYYDGKITNAGADQSITLILNREKLIVKERKK